MALRSVSVMAVVAGVLLGVSAASAGVLDGNPDALVEGSSTFSNGDFIGSVDYAVFSQAGFASAFPTATYTTARARIYAYQVNVDPAGDDFASSKLTLTPSTFFGDFSAITASGDVAPIIPPDSDGMTYVFWTFPGGISPGNSSEILLLAANYEPVMGVDVVFNGGSSDELAVTVPGTTFIPEPVTAALLGMGGVLVLRRRR